MIFSVHPKLKQIREKVENGERLSFDDGVLMYDPEIPVNDLGQLANVVRENKNGNAAYYNINTHFERDERLCVSMYLLCVSIGLAQPEGLCDGRRTNTRTGKGSR